MQNLPTAFSEEAGTDKSEENVSLHQWTEEFETESSRDVFRLSHFPKLSTTFQMQNMPTAFIGEASTTTLEKHVSLQQWTDELWAEKSSNEITH